MSVQIVLHKGYQGICYENSMVGILLAIFKKKFCEIDVLYVHGEWKLCHDFDTLTLYHTKLSSLLETLKQYKSRIQKPIIVDVKWDFIKNRHDNLDNAIQKLKALFAGFEEVPMWFQAPNPQVLEQFQMHHFLLQPKWRLGMIVQDMEQFRKYRGHLSYVMISMSDFTGKDIGSMSLFCPVFGYTCNNMKELSNYTHLFPHLKGIVCDVYV